MFLCFTATGMETPTLASARIQRWALTLGTYDYSIQYKPGPDHSNADVLSRLPLLESTPHIPTPGENITALTMLESLPVTSREIRKWTDRDPILSKERVLLRNRWKHTSEEALKPYQQRHSELSLQDNCVLWGLGLSSHHLVKRESSPNSMKAIQEFLA